MINSLGFVIILLHFLHFDVSNGLYMGINTSTLDSREGCSTKIFKENFRGLLENRKNEGVEESFNQNNATSLVLGGFKELSFRNPSNLSTIL